MDTFSEFENYRRRYLCDYFRKIIIQSEKYNLLLIHSYITTPFTFILFESFSLVYLYRKLMSSIGPERLLTFRLASRYAVILTGVTLLNMNFFLRNFLDEYPYQEADRSLPFEEMKISQLTEKPRYSNKLQCFLNASTSPGFCINKDIFLLKFLNVVLLPYIIYINYINEKGKR